MTLLPLMTIAHVTAPAAFGGLERVVVGLCREMAERGHRVVLILTLSPLDGTPVWAEELRAANVTVECLRLSGRSYLAEWRAVRALLRLHRVDLVHTHGYRADVVNGAAARREGCRLVSTAHGFASTGGRGKLYEWLQMRAWRRFDAVVAVSQPLRALLMAAGVPQASLHFIRNGLIASGSARLDRTQARERLGLPQEGTVIGWVGRLSEEKAPALAVEAIARCSDPRTLLCIVGTGPLLEACRARSLALGVGDRVRFAGAVADASKLFDAFDALVLSSRTEGTPMVVLEAAAAGVAVVSTAVGGVPDLLGDERGWLVPAGDSVALGHAIEAATADRHESRRRAQRLRTFLESGVDSDWVTQYLGLYRSLLAG